MFGLTKALIAAVLLAGWSGAAMADTYDCAARTTAGKSTYAGVSYIAPTIRFVVDEAAGTATVYDSVIAAEHGGPIAAEYSQPGGNKIRFEWSLYVPFKKNRRALADYQLTLNRSRMTASIRVAVHGDFQDTLGKATCQVTP